MISKLISQFGNQQKGGKDKESTFTKMMAIILTPYEFLCEFWWTKLIFCSLVIVFFCFRSATPNWTSWLFFIIFFVCFVPPVCVLGVVFIWGFILLCWSIIGEAWIARKERLERERREDVI
ncbi:MAG: hypothetical protein V1871_07520 [Planctomycetota bacterium]